MNKTVKRLALVALCTSALTAVSQTSQAQVFNITGSAANGFTYGTAPGANNVVNFGGATSTGSQVVDPGTTPSTWLGSTGVLNSFVSVTGLAANQTYTINWTYVGSESDNTIRFTVPNQGNTLVNGAIPTNDDNRNNSCVTCQPGHANPAPVVAAGSTQYINGGTNVPQFTLTDVQTGTAVTNGSTNGAPGSGIASLIFSYANFTGGNWVLTTSATDFVVFGFNDNGFGDDNHDDFMGVMTLVPGGIQNPTPIPGALPLFGTVLGGGYLFRRLRKRKAA